MKPSGGIAFTPEAINVPHALHEAIEILQADSVARRVEVQIEADEGIESVVTNCVRLRQMLLALIGNAIKFSHEGGCVEVGASSLDDLFWQVTDTDEGVGIAEANLSACSRRSCNSVPAPRRPTPARA